MPLSYTQNRLCHYYLPQTHPSDRKNPSYGLFVVVYVRKLEDIHSKYKTFHEHLIHCDGNQIHITSFHYATETKMKMKTVLSKNCFTCLIQQRLKIKSSCTTLRWTREVFIAIWGTETKKGLNFSAHRVELLPARVRTHWQQEPCWNGALWQQHGKRTMTNHKSSSLHRKTSSTQLTCLQRKQDVLQQSHCS